MKQRVPSTIYSKEYSCNSVWCHRCHAGGAATTTPSWKASGDYLKMNGCITDTLRLAPRPFRLSPNTSYFTGGSANRYVWDVCLLPHLSASSMKIGWRHEPVGVHVLTTNLTGCLLCATRVKIMKLNDATSWK